MITNKLLKTISSKHAFMLCATILSASLAMPSALSLPDDSKKPIDIEADSFDFNQAEGWGEYRGNVIATQGSLKVLAETLRVTFADEGGFEKIEATGNPVNFSMLPEAGKERMVGIGQKLIYYVPSKQMEVHTNASVSQGKDKITGNLIQYNVDTTELKARNQGKGRVTVRITPKADN